ncbi:glutamyl-tRNA(Gln) amidotransferase subunit B, mitochondrial [Megalopta genalis]|uniref:glutamyl-tRNA(Gln) amidotransferase subunit B, mitochondrial n=1 Tax=Megalopta genalis TaxID=115081 RepID=UPI003FD45C26
MLLSRKSCVFVKKYHKKICKRFKSMNTSEWKPTIGLEIHAQIATTSKLFSGASTDFNSPINSCVSLFDCAIPGTMPVLNKKCVETGVLTALALSCELQNVSMFERKHYFYSDLPAGFQITQHRKPLAMNGEINFMVFNPSIHKEPYMKSSMIKQIQLEQDSGRSYHHEELGKSLIDLNRSGVPLMELVFEPDLTNGEEAAALVKELSMILQLIGVCSCKMEEGALRVDANVSVSKENEPLGTRTEIKNIGSVRAICNAVEYEIKRQILLLQDGGRVINETRAWDVLKKKTIIMREKEDNHDYRFMPEPNLPLLRIHVDENTENKYNFVDGPAMKKQVPELPGEIRKKLMDSCLTPHMILAVMSDLEILELFRTLIKKDKNRIPQLTAQVMLTHFIGFIQHNKLDIKFVMDNIDHFGQMVDLLQNKQINHNILHKVLKIFFEKQEKEPKQIVEENNWFMITDEKELEKLCLDIMNKNPKLVAKFKRGKTKAFSKFIHEALKATNECADTPKIIKIFSRLLG